MYGYINGCIIVRLYVYLYQGCNRRRLAKGGETLKSKKLKFRANIAQNDQFSTPNAPKILGTWNLQENLDLEQFCKIVL